MYLITKHITRFNGFHSDIILGYVDTKEEAKKCIDELNKSTKEHYDENACGISHFLFKKLEKFDINSKY